MVCIPTQHHIGVEYYLLHPSPVSPYICISPTAKIRTCGSALLMWSIRNFFLFGSQTSGSWLYQELNTMAVRDWPLPSLIVLVLWKWTLCLALQRSKNYYKKISLYQNRLYETEKNHTSLHYNIKTNGHWTGVLRLNPLSVSLNHIWRGPGVGWGWVNPS